MLKLLLVIYRLLSWKYLHSSHPLCRTPWWWQYCHRRLFTVSIPKRR